MERLLRVTLPNGRFSDVPVVRSRTMAAIRGRNNRTTELRFRMALVRSSLSGWVTHIDLPGKPDFYFPAAKLAVFIDGCFWHGCTTCGHIPKTNSVFWATKIERNRTRDQRNTRLLRKQGFRIFRAWEHSLKSAEDLGRVVKRIEHLLLRSGM